MRAMSFLAAASAAASLVAVALLAPSCFGPSDLAKAYEPYNAKVEKLLDAESETGRRLEKLFKSQYDDETPDFQRYADYVEKTAVPFYDDLVAKTKALEPVHAGLAATQAELVKYVQFRAEFAHVLASSLDALKFSDTTRTLQAKEVAAERTKQLYVDTLKGPAASPEGRFSELDALAKDFQNSCLLPMSSGQKSARDVADYVRKNIVPQVAKLRATNFDDDESSRRLRDAVAASEEFYAALLEDLKPMEARARLSRAAEQSSQAAADALKKFKEALAEVRRLK
jgi:hypothetical protein